jgi:hypothetical protein
VTAARTAAALVLLAACSQPRDPVARAADTTSPEGRFAAAPAGPADSAGGPCPAGPLWTLCSVRERLERSGLAPRPGAEVRHGFLHVPGQRFAVGDAELQAFVYATAEMRRRDTAPLDSVRVTPPGADAQWERPPTLITSDNLAAILVGGNQRQVERVTLALTAGAGSTDFQPAGGGPP